MYSENAAVGDPLMHPGHRDSETPSGISDHAVTTVSPRGRDSADDTATEIKIEPASRMNSSSLNRFNRLRALWIDGWITEFLSCGLAVIAFIGLVVTLRIFNGHVLTEVPLKISINTLAAVFSAVTKSSLLLPVAEGISQLKWAWFSRGRPLSDFEGFDSASRGPMGSLLLVFRLRGRNVAAIGACITVLALAVDPFAQQIIRPISCHRDISGGAAAIPQTNRMIGIGSHTGAGTASIPLELDIAIQAALLNVTEPLNVECTTGNCTFPTESRGEAYQTLGIDSLCVDRSKDVEEDNSLGITYSWPDFGNSSICHSDYSFNGTSCHSSVIGIGSTSQSNDQGLVTAGFLMFTQDCSANQTDQCLVPLAVECSLWPAILTLGASVEIGRLQQDLLSSQPLEHYQDTTGAPWMQIPERTLRNGSWQPCSPTDTSTADNTVQVYGSDSKEWQLWPDSGESLPSQWYPADCVWYIDYETNLALQQYLAGLLEASIYSTSGPVYPYTFVGEYWLKILYGNVDATASRVAAFAQQIANATTIWVQSNPKRNATIPYTHGTAVQTTTCIEVRWAWLSFPSSLILLTLAFLILTARKTRAGARWNAPRSTWKSSPLAVLFVGLAENERRQYAQVDKTSDMINRSRNMSVSLQPTNDGWRLCGSDDAYLESPATRNKSPPEAIERINFYS
ncbi:hypothetical protein K491DRAFT_784470 [Lophiostoma macrostomum CBS 122681]|uniref:Uncharacterized protein n=1 Tax=Lophiostoma macrostomum CBS 122681 TaxID=1314788 RepID=A0A6A6SNT3_9PLEO|nr:hypothetical protein K491DRAFT_784470 [Lophiostoma macrostomum CBS 122681]